MRKSWLKNLMPLAASVALTFVLAEVFCRVYLFVKFDKPIERYHKYGYDRTALLAFEMIPNIRNRYLPGLQTTYSTNDRGFRGKTNYGPKDPGELRIALLGGSCVFGHSATSDATTIGAYLQAQLADAFPGRKVTVINAGNPGHNSYQVLARTQLRLLDLEPDIYVLYMGWNDYLGSWKRRSFARGRFAAKHTYFHMHSWQAFIQHDNRDVNRKWARPFALTYLAKKPYSAIKKALAAQSTEGSAGAAIAIQRELDLTTVLKLAKIPMADEIRPEVDAWFYDNLLSLAAITRERGATSIFVTLCSEFDVYPEDRERINKVIRQAAATMGMPLLDADLMVQREGKTGINAIDHVHFTDAGNAYLAGLIATEVENVME